ncbi:LytR C-terminal domain-containing protein [Streptacidiphilus sp. N1-12]|uniref:LytR C-terminal domain-containing protein n=2 Tax=Streptacidiphilus alkalitolerans TaxID=3342712 RepID=A0ABV6WF70_9ACTN
MLTPPGLKGKQYRVTGTAYPRLARPNHRRRLILLAITGVTVLAVLGWGTSQLLDVFGGKKSTAAAGCGTKVAAHGDSVPSGAASASPSAGSSAAAGTKAGAGAGASAGAGAALAVVPKPTGITVNVYNATDRAGLAGQTAAELKKRGFTIGKIGNAPTALQHKVLGTAQVTGNSAAAKLMTVVGTEVTGAKPVTDLRKDTTVDLILGNGFTTLATPAQAAQALALATRPTATPSPAHC